MDRNTDSITKRVKEIPQSLFTHTKRGTTTKESNWKIRCCLNISENCAQVKRGSYIMHASLKSLDPIPGNGKKVSLKMTQTRTKNFCNDTRDVFF